MLKPRKPTFKIFGIIILVIILALFAQKIPGSLDILDLKEISGYILSPLFIPMIFISKLGLSHPDSWFPNLKELALLFVTDIIILYIISTIIALFISKRKPRTDLKS